MEEPFHKHVSTTSVSISAIALSVRRPFLMIVLPEGKRTCRNCRPHTRLSGFQHRGS